MTFIELGVEDADRGRAFYEAVFGWRFEPGPSGNGYMIHTPDGRAGIHGGDAERLALRLLRSTRTSTRRWIACASSEGVVEDVDVEGDEEVAGPARALPSCATTIRARPSGLHQPPAA